jgi:hypothetical protein
VALWLLCHDERGVVSKEKMRAQYDGSLWQVVADEVAAKRAGAWLRALCCGAAGLAN